MIFAQDPLYKPLALAGQEESIIDLPMVGNGIIHVTVLIPGPSTPPGAHFPNLINFVDDPLVKIDFIQGDKIVYTSTGTIDENGQTKYHTVKVPEIVLMVHSGWKIKITNLHDTIEQVKYRVYISYPSNKPILKRKISLSFFRRALDEFWNDYQPIEKITLDFSHDSNLDAYTFGEVIEMVERHPNGLAYLNGLPYMYAPQPFEIEKLKDNHGPHLKFLAKHKDKFGSISIRDEKSYNAVMHEFNSSGNSDFIKDLLKLSNNKESQKVFLKVKKELIEDLLPKNKEKTRLTILPESNTIAFTTTKGVGGDIEVKFKNAGNNNTVGFSLFEISDSQRKKLHGLKFFVELKNTDYTLITPLDTANDNIPSAQVSLKFFLLRNRINTGGYFNAPDRIELNLGIDAALDLSIQITLDIGVKQYDVDEIIRNRFSEELNLFFSKQLQKLKDRIIPILLGDEFHVIDAKVEQDDVVIEYIGKPIGNMTIGFQPLIKKAEPKGNLAKIDHIVVLMMENRSFDHMLGYLKKDEGRSSVNGLTGTEFNTFQGKKFMVNKLTDTRIEESPGHDVEAVSRQMNNNMGGFVADFFERHGKKLSARLEDVMGYYGKESVPVYHELATKFGICDNWFCAHPGPTWPNRFITYTGKLNRNKDGLFEFDNPAFDTFDLLETPTIFDYLTNVGVSWKVFEHGYSFIRLFTKYTFDTTNVISMNNPAKGFFAAAKAGKLPSVTFIEPDYIDVPPGNDDHPPADIMRGQNFIKEIVNALANGPQWNKTALIITYDEHGGFFDHVIPPSTAVSLGMTTQYGPRVPTFVISPWVKAQTVSHETFDHTSILATIRNRFIHSDYPVDLGPRVPKAKDIGSLLSLGLPRNDKIQLKTDGISSRALDVFPKRASLPSLKEKDFHELLFAIRLLRGYPPR